VRHNVVDVWGAEGEGWLATVPLLVGELADAWGLQIHGPPGPLSFHYVVQATRKDRSPAVLKIGPTGPGHLAIEAAALDAYAGHGAVQLLAYDPARGALLLEQASPGASAAALVPVDDDAATAAIIEVTRRLHDQPASQCPLPDLATLGKALPISFARVGAQTCYPTVGCSGRPLCSANCARARRARSCGTVACTTATCCRPPASRGWRSTITVCSETGYETGSLLYNPWPQRREAELLALVPARIE
jgi:streptomycin 6-kinase